MGTPLDGKTSALNKADKRSFAAGVHRFVASTGLKLAGLLSSIETIGRVFSALDEEVAP